MPDIEGQVFSAVGRLDTLRYSTRLFPFVRWGKQRFSTSWGQTGRCDSEGEAIATLSQPAPSLHLASWTGLGPAEQWYALHTRARHEKVVEQRLHERDVETYLPLVTEIHRWSDRKKTVQLPLFSGYIFVRLSYTTIDRLRVLTIDGVFTFVGVRGEGTPIPQAQIEAVRALVKGGLPWSSHPFLRIGQRVRIRSGALDGIEGILIDRTGDSTLVISVDAIQRSLAVRVEGYNVERI